jgi:glycosyltransferase involved in cell wall biosynthesis
MLGGDGPGGQRAGEATGRRLVYVVTASMTAQGFLRGQLSYMRARGFEVTLVASPDTVLHAIGETEGVEVRGVPMSRSISPLRDLRSLLLLTRLFRELRPDIVSVGTPKAGLLAGMAAAICRVPRRIYTLHGLRLEGASGAKRNLLAATEWIACRCAHTVHCVSPSLRDSVVSRRLTAPSKAVVLGNGSCNGLNTAWFQPAEGPIAAARVRRRLGIPRDARVIGYVGRLTRDKGIRELVEAYVAVRRERPDLHLLLVGQLDDTDPLDGEVRSTLERHDAVTMTGWVANPAPYYHCMSVFVLPTYREGLPQTALEASASAVPVVTTDATGARDAVVDGVTGLVVRRRDTVALTMALARFLDDPELACRLGRQGRAWVIRAFEQERLWANLVRLYETKRCVRS